MKCCCTRRTAAASRRGSSACRERVQSVRFSPDGAKLAVAGGSPGRMGEIQIWDVAKKKLDLSVSITFDTLYGASWSPDGKYVAFGGSDNAIRAIEAATGKEILFSQSANDWVLDTVWSTKGNLVAAASRDMAVKLIEVETRAFRGQHHLHHARRVARRHPRAGAPSAAR